MKSRYILLLVLFISSILMTQAEAGSKPKDGELKFPFSYDTFPSFLKAVQKPKHVRELFVNSTGFQAEQGKPFPNGSILVMEIFVAKQEGGKTVKRVDGKNVKDNLAKVYVMQKQSGWGSSAPKGLKNGDWIYSAFTPEGKPLKADYGKCRGCHLPLKEKDFVHRYDEFFNQREQ